MRQRKTPAPPLFIEGLKMRPTALRVLTAMLELGAVPAMMQDGCSTQQIAQHTGLSSHVIRARLQDLRRLGLIDSGTCPQWAPRNVVARYAHYLTPEGHRRVQVQ